jgi:hypothetical protein
MHARDKCSGPMTVAQHSPQLPHCCSQPHAAGQHSTSQPHAAGQHSTSGSRRAACPRPNKASAHAGRSARRKLGGCRVTRGGHAVCAEAPMHSPATARPWPEWEWQQRRRQGGAVTRACACICGAGAAEEAWGRVRGRHCLTRRQGRCQPTQAARAGQQCRLVGRPEQLAVGVRQGSEWRGLLQTALIPTCLSYRPLG